MADYYTFIQAHDLKSIKSKNKTLEDSYVYVQPNCLKDEILKFSKRKFVRIYKTNSDLYIIRQLRAMSVEGFVQSENQSKKVLKPITMSYLNELEIEASSNCTITIKPTSWYDFFKLGKYTNEQKNIHLTKIGVFISILGAALGFILK